MKIKYRIKERQKRARFWMTQKERDEMEHHNRERVAQALFGKGSTGKRGI